MHNFKAIKQLFEQGVFASESEEQKTVVEESKKEESPLKHPPKEFESPSKESPQKPKSSHTELQIQPLKDPIITTLAKNFLLILFDYFDPISLIKLGLTCKYLHEVATHSGLFKKFCLILFPVKQTLPSPNQFQSLQDYINKNPLEFDDLLRQRANFDIRSIVWGSNNYLDEYKTPSSFYKQFGNWRNCYLQVPRVSLKGYYVLREKYLKIGEKDFHQTYDPIIIVEYFRYLRFFDNGLVMMVISSMKMVKDKILKIFKKAMNSEDNDMIENPMNLFLNQNKPKNEMKQTVLKGEYLRKEAKIFIKFCSKGSSVYEYELLIKSSQEGKNDKLIVEKKTDRELTTNFVRDDNDQRASGVKMFEFKRVEEFAEDCKDLRVKSVTL